MGYDPNQPTQGQGYGPPHQPPPQYSLPQRPPYEQPTQYSPPQQPPYGQPQYGVPPVPNYTTPPQQPRKGSLRWLWITLAVVGGLAVLACAGCAITAALGIGFFARTVSGPTLTVDGYYKALEQQDYATAYTYLDTSSTTTVQGQQVTKQAFMLSEQIIDRALGKVTDYTITNTNVDQSGKLAAVTVNVIRNGRTTTQDIKLRMIGSDWKIVGGNSAQSFYNK